MATIRVRFKDVPDVEKLGKRISLSSDKGGKCYTIHHPHSEPSLDIPKELIECVTLIDSEVYTSSLRPGVYKRDGNRFVVDTHKGTRDGSYFQSIEGSGPTIGSIMENYSLLRQGKLWPEEDWEAPQIVPSRINLKGLLKSYWIAIRDRFNDLFRRLITPKK